MSTFRQKHSHLYAPKTREIRLTNNTPFPVPAGRNLILKVYTDSALPHLKLSVDSTKAKEGDRVLVENIPGTSEVPLTIVFGEANTVAGAVAAKKDETFRLVAGAWLLETPSGEGGGEGGGAVDSVNGQTGVVVLSADDVGAAAEEHDHAISDVTGLQDELDKIDTKAEQVLLGLPDIVINQSPSTPFQSWRGVYTPSQIDNYELSAGSLTGRIQAIWVRYYESQKWEIRWDSNEAHWTLNPEGGAAIATLASEDPYDYTVFQDGSWTLLSGSRTPTSVIRWSQRVSNDDYRIKTFRGATTEENGVAGIVPPPAIGDETKYLKGNGTFSAIDAAEVTTGVFDNARINFGSPAPIGGVVPNTGAFSTLSATGTATLPHIHGSIAGNLYVHVRNNAGGPLVKGTPVYAMGSVGDTDRVLVGPANQASTATMPALGLLAQDLANNADGDCIIIGELQNFNTSTYSINQELFVGGQGLSGTRPTTGEVQSVGTISRVQQNTGIIVVNMQARRAPNESFAAAVHNHTIAQITNLQTTLDGKEPIWTDVAPILINQEPFYLPASLLWNKSVRLDGLGGTGTATIVLPQIGTSGQDKYKRIAIELTNTIQNGTQYLRKQIVFKIWNPVQGAEATLVTIPSINEIGSTTTNATKYHIFENSPRTFSDGQTWYHNTAQKVQNLIIPVAGSNTPQPLGIANPGTSANFSREDHVHALPAIPAASDATPQSLGTGAAGTLATYSRADHVHPHPGIFYGPGLILTNYNQVFQNSGYGPGMSETSPVPSVFGFYPVGNISFTINPSDIFGVGGLYKIRATARVTGAFGDGLHVLIRRVVIGSGEVNVPGLVDFGSGLLEIYTKVSNTLTATNAFEYYRVYFAAYNGGNGATVQDVTITLERA